MRRILAAIRAALPDWHDLHLYGGIGLLAWGTWMAWEPGGVIVLGAGLFGLGIAASVRARRGGAP